MPAITVIMPSFNVASYIEECIKSVRNQTLKDIEIIAIDGGSTDGTLESLRKYEAQDSRIKIHMSEKRSYGYQINWGMDHAKGEYIAVVETDDYIMPDMLETLYEIAQRTGVDYVKGNHDDVVCLPDGEVWSHTVKPIGIYKEKQIYHKVIEPKEYPMLIKSDNYLWRGIYRRSFIKENGIRFHESEGAAFQDIGFLLQTISFAKRALYVDKSFYCYRRANIGASVYNEKGFSYLEGEYEFVEKVMQTHWEQYERLRGYCYSKLFDQCAGRARTMASSGKRWENIEEAVCRLHGKLQTAFQKGQMDAGISGNQSWLEMMMFLDNPEKYFDYQFHIYDTQRGILRNMLEGLRRHSHIVLFGCSKMMGFVYCLLQRNHFHNIGAFCDNNVLKWGTCYMGKKVIAVEEAAEDYKDATFIIANSVYLDDMKKQLLQLGVKQNNIYVYGLGIDLLLLSMK